MSQENSSHSGDDDVQHSPQSVVTLYVVPDCPLCARARWWLERHGIAYAERNVAGDFGALRKMYKLTGQRLVPVFELAGRAIVRPTDGELEEFLLCERELGVRSQETE